MAVSHSQSNPQLSRSQQNLLLAALNAQAGDKTPTSFTTDASGPSGSSTLQSASVDTMDQSNLFISPQSAELDSFNDFTPDLDYLDGDGNFDFENADLGGEMIGALPGSGEEGYSKGEQHDKRKSPDENDDDEEGDAKRQETGEGEKGNKKPGRKPLTNEPTTKRKAQNRAAQRAFRERKEKHLKDLETKVAELTKTQEADKHEKGLLKAQVERLQVELKDYRKRLSLGSTIGRSPPLNATQRRSNSGNNNQFQFDFPKFGDLPGSQMLNNGNNTPPASTHSPSNYSQSNAPGSRQDSNARSLSPGSATGNGSKVASPEAFGNAFPSAGYSTNDNMHGFASTLPQMNNDPFGDLFSPSILKNAGNNHNSYFSNGQTTQSPNTFVATDGGDSTAGLSRVFQFNSGSTVSDSASPSASSSSQWNVNTANSSCGTTPEPSHGSPANKDTKQVGSINQQNTLTNSTNHTITYPNNDYTLPSANNYDPVLFGDYRDNQDPLLGNTADFTGGFFDDALNAGPFDFGSPSNLFGILSPEQSNATVQPKNSGAAPSRNLMAEVEKARDGGDDDFGLTTKPAQPKMINCNNIWNQLQSNPEFQDGKFDLDNLCSELKAKARCSESGVMVDQSHVNAALKKLSKKTADGAPPADMPPLMFEQDSWDSVLKKMGGNAQV